MTLFNQLYSPALFVGSPFRNTHFYHGLLVRFAVKRALIEVNQKHQNAAGVFRVRGFIIKEIA